MEPFGILEVAASIITCLQLTGKLLKRVGPSGNSRKDLNEVSIAICGFQGAYEGLKSYLQLHDEDEPRLSALQHLEEPLRDYKQILGLLEKRLGNTNFVGQYIVGTLWDAKLKRGLKRLQDAKTLFEIALNADQRVIFSAVERYIRNVAEDVQDLSSRLKKNVNISSGHSGCALTAAVENGQKTIVNKLLMPGANVNISFGRSGCAVAAAVEHGQEMIVNKLLNAGADVNILSYDHGNALPAAAAKGHETIVILLLNDGANVNISGRISSSYYYGTALQAAAAKGHEMIVDKLLNAGADVNISTGRYGSALAAAVELGHETIVNKLLKAGADVNTSSGSHGNPLAAAMEYGHEAIKDTLLKARATYRLDVMAARWRRLWSADTK
ncbi:hypothetical protein MMC22_007734 [Lobaria immixta]|nr:hypothetical protein [Lobaria immixta]